MLCALLAPALWAQQVETKVVNADVVYVEGSIVVLKLTNGDVKQFEIPDSYRFTIDGKDVTVRELTPRMPVPMPEWPVWKIAGSNLLLKTPDGENKMYRVPSGEKIIIEGKEKNLDQLHEGDKITATVVTTRASEETGKAVAAVHQPPATPARVGVLLIDEGAKPTTDRATPANETVTPGNSAGTWGASSIILLVVVLLAIGALVLLAFRRRKKTGVTKPPAVPMH